MERVGLKKGGKTPNLQGLFTHSDKGLEQGSLTLFASSGK
jgi:hypothetical protein